MIKEHEDSVSPPRQMMLLLGPNIGWVAIYFFAWGRYLSGHELPGILWDIFYYDLIVNVVTPWILVPLLILYAVWIGRPVVRGVLAVFGVLFLGSLCGLLLWAAIAILHHHGGWSLVAVVPVLASKISWRSLRQTSPGGFNAVLLRSVLAPTFCFAPALIISCVVFRRNTLGVNQSDYIGLFGIIYFGAQAFLDYALARGYEGRGPFAPSGAR